MGGGQGRVRKTSLGLASGVSQTGNGGGLDEGRRGGEGKLSEEHLEKSVGTVQPNTECVWARSGE